MADVRVNLAVVGPYHNLFTYKLRDKDALNLRPGCRFLVPFGPTHKVGFYIETQTEEVAYRLKFARERIDTFSPFPPYLFDLCRWIAEYYYAGPGETLAAALPGTGTKKPKLEFVADDEDFFKSLDLDHKPAADLAARFAARGAVREDAFSQDKLLIALIKDWLDRGVIVPRYRIRAQRKKLIGYRLMPGAEDKTAEPFCRLQPGIIYPRQQLTDNFGLSAYRLEKLTKTGILEKVYDETGLADLTTYPIRHDLPGLALMDGQQKVLDRIVPAVESKKFAPFMLFGITGSGKTLVYCHAARKAVASGGSVLVMVPEIALSGILLSSFAAFFGDRVAVIHSGLTANQRYAVRQKIGTGEIKIVIGPRSAIFSPLKDPRLIIVDEEHDPSYKQDDPAPRYHARDAAVMLARMLDIPVILGSASPSMESYHNAVTGRYELLTLDQRPKSGYKMPAIEMLDMKSEKISGECSFLAYRLKRETEKHLASGGQVIYYLNRRGFAPRIKCRDCGYVPACADCRIKFTYHRHGHQLKCHFCDRTEPAPARCPVCGGTEFIYIGAGTQRVEENLSRLFSDIKAERIDSDKAALRSGRLILSDFAAEKFNLLVGTQMVTKGLDIPGVTLVGVLSADIGLDMPDFRAAEKTYARLLQVAGRAGRGEREGKVLIQTYYTEHAVIKHLIDGDYVRFYESVIPDRRDLNYPPFTRLISIVLSGKDEKLLETEALAFRFRLEKYLSALDDDKLDRPARAAHQISGNTASGGSGKAAAGGFRLLGPSPAPLYKLRGLYRRRLLIKCRSVRKILARFRHWESLERNYALPSKINITFDIDPLGMM